MHLTIECPLSASNLNKTEKLLRAQANRTNECEMEPCANGAACTDLYQDFSCLCIAGFTGKSCGESKLLSVLTSCYSNVIHYRHFMEKTQWIVLKTIGLTAMYSIIIKYYQTPIRKTCAASIFYSLDSVSYDDQLIWFDLAQRGWSQYIHLFSN